ncbi:MAG: hypothetical protein EBT15_10095 [Betaproteobacteria bacterium]|nr:hypothetical protein [Betaproteobacteria bacterium]
MATDFAPYANLRMLWQPPGTITNFRAGVPAAGPAVVIEAFAKAKGRSEQDLPGVKAGDLILEGYLTRWALLGNASWLVAGASLSWNDTGYRPAGMLPGATGQAVLTNLTMLPTLADGAEQGKLRMLELSQPFGVGGIGIELREALGDKFRAALSTAI